MCHWLIGFYKRLIRRYNYIQFGGRTSYVKIHVTTNQSSFKFIYLTINLKVTAPNSLYTALMQAVIAEQVHQWRTIYLVADMRTST